MFGRIMMSLACTFALSGSALAEGVCPPGYFPVTGNGPTGCIPFPGNGGVPPDPGPEWSSRWGAIVTAAGVFGTAENAPTRRKAEKAAMKQCKANGGKNCTVALSFGNQCGALAWGDNYSFVAPSGEQASAEAAAMKNCDAHTQNCKVYYSSCSYAKRLR